MEENIQSIQLTLEELKDKFESWRKNKTNHREPIPKELWQAAADLARDSSINTVSKVLHLSYQDLKDRLYGPSALKHKTRKKCTSFVELKYSQPLQETTTTVDIENKRGCKMRIYLKGAADILELVKSFCGL
jgi:hypothetical protein